MTTRIRRETFDFVATDYRTVSPKIEILGEGYDPAAIEAQPEYGDSFVQRWYLSLQGEDAPLFSDSAHPDRPRIYRYDWAFGISLTASHHWDWMAELCENSALAIHIALIPVGDSPEAVPIGATLSALHPSRNTGSDWDWAKLSRLASDATRIGAKACPPLGYVSDALTLTSNLLASDSDGRKNWFLYQFFDENLKCPAVEWRVNKQVLREYGPLLRGSLFLAFHGSAESNPGHVRLMLRPQIRYCEEGDINFLAPTGRLAPGRQVWIDATPTNNSPGTRAISSDRFAQPAAMV